MYNIRKPGYAFSLAFLSLILFSSAVQSQDQGSMLLTFDEAVQIALEQNYGIQISRNLQVQAANNRTLGNAGFLPEIYLTGSRTETVEDSKFEQASGVSQTSTGARSTSTNAGINLDWTLFDGFQMFTTYDRLEKLREVSDEELRSDMEALISQISFSYFNIVRINEQLKILANNIEVSEERMEIEETKVDLGSGSEYELLQARSDLNADRAAYLREHNRLNEAKILLNELLSRNPETGFDVPDDIPVNRSLSREALFQQLTTRNAQLSIARMQQELSRLEMREIRGERFPEIALTSGYRFNRNENDGGFFILNETTGFSIGLTARFNIFDGFNLNRRVQNAHISVKNAELALESQKLRLESEFFTIYRTWANSIELIDLEEENLQHAEETLDIALERFRIGTISSLEFREAQRTFMEAENRLVNAKYEAKIAETELLHLAGELDSLMGDR